MGFNFGLDDVSVRARLEVQKRAESKETYVCVKRDLCVRRAKWNLCVGHNEISLSLSLSLAHTHTNK